LRVRYDVNVGAYMAARSVTPITNIGGIAAVYTTPAIAADVHGWFTNTQMTTAYRGAGRPDATYAIERVIDVAAMELGLDPAELRPAQTDPGSGHALPDAVRVPLRLRRIQPRQGVEAGRLRRFPRAA